MDNRNYVSGVLVTLTDPRFFGEKEDSKLRGASVWGALENDTGGERVTLSIVGYGDVVNTAFKGMKKFTRIGFKGQMVKARDYNRKSDGALVKGGFEIQIAEFQILGVAAYEKRELPIAQVVANGS